MKDLHISSIGMKRQTHFKIRKGTPMSLALTKTRTSLPTVGALVSVVTLALATWKQRKDLASLDAIARSDLGLTDAQVYIEANRPIWDVPHNWQR
jgi:uncharacterized protein YjiS (DUF1127 family)